MNYYVDTEFYERGHKYPVQLISVGIVAADGREYYAEVKGLDRDSFNPWLKENVVPHLTGPVKSRDRIASDILNLIAADKRPVFWGYFSDYDWVLFAQLFGTMVDMPSILPHSCMDLRQEMVRLGVNKKQFASNIDDNGPAHNALADARWNVRLHKYLVSKGGMP